MVEAGTSFPLKVVLLGDAAVGKSSLVTRFVQDVFKIETEPTMGANFLSKSIFINSKEVKFNIWDTAGQERYHALTKMYYRDTMAAILVYDITQPKSFDSLKMWHKELKAYGPKNIVVAIAGNKEDLISEEKVDWVDVKNWSDSMGAIFKKTSARTSHGVDNIFREIALRFDFTTGEAAAVPPNVRGSIKLDKNNGKKQKKKCC